MQAVVLVGGLGTRLRPLTTNRPKPLLPIVNQPFIVAQLHRLRDAGIDEVILAVQYLADQFERVLGDGSDFKLRLRIVEEPEPRGTAGALRHVAHMLHGPTFVLNGDTVTDLDLKLLLQHHQQTGATLTLALTEVDDPTASGMVECDVHDRVRRFIEKPRPEQVTTKRVNAGSYLLDPSALNLIPANQPASLERDLFPQLIASGAPVYGLLSAAYVGDFGTPATYLAVHEAILSGKMHFPLPNNHFAEGIWLEGNAEIDPSAILRGPILLGPGVQIGPEAQISGPTVLGAGCRIGARAQVERSVVWNDAEIQNGAKIQDSILANGCQIGHEAIVEEFSVLGDNCSIGANNHLRHGIRLAPGTRLEDHSVTF